MQKLRAKVWVYDGPAAWHFISVPKTDSARYRELYADMHAGWGSLPVKVTIGQTTWKTSIFYDRKSSSYLLPLKKEVRKKEGLIPGQEIEFTLEILY